MEKSVGEHIVESAITNYSDMVYRIAFQYTRSDSDAEDVVQEVFLKLLGQVKKDPLEEEALKSWLIRVAINECNSFFRGSKIERNAVRDYEAPSPKEDYDDVFEALGKLDPLDRNVLYLHYYEGYSAKEIASLLGGNERAITKRLGRAREKMKQFL